MASPNALFAAVDLAKAPRLVGIMRHRPLPPDVLMLIQIAAGSEEKLTEAAAMIGRETTFVHGAALFYIRQILWASDADNYRVLGVPPDATAARIAEHLRWYMKWLHPDSGGENIQKRFAARVLRAWEALKTPERRRAYDRALAKEPGRSAGGPAARLSARRIPWISEPPAQTSPSKRWLSIAAIGASIAIVAGLSVLSIARQLPEAQSEPGSPPTPIETAGPAPLAP